MVTTPSVGTSVYLDFGRSWFKDPHPMQERILYSDHYPLQSIAGVQYKGTSSRV